MAQADVSTVQVKVPAEYVQSLAVNVCPAITICVTLSWLTVSVELSRSTKVTVTSVVQLHGVDAGGDTETMRMCDLNVIITVPAPSLKC